MHTPQESKSLALSHETELENIHTAAKEDFGFEKLLKFAKGEFFVGQDEVPLGTEFIAHCTMWVKGWIKFNDDDEPPQRKMYRVAYGETPPEREDLDDLNLIGAKDGQRYVGRSVGFSVFVAAGKPRDGRGADLRHVIGRWQARRGRAV